MDSKQLMFMKRELATTVNSRGWSFVVSMAEATIKEMETKCFDEEDEVKGAALRRKVKAARDFWSNFLTNINITKQITDEDVSGQPDDDFYEPAM